MINRVSFAFTLYFFGMLLIPFSTTPDHGGVISFGTPIIILAIVLFTPYLITSLLTIDWRFLVLPSLYVFAIILSCFLSPVPLQSFVRAGFNVVGFVSFLCVIGFLMENPRLKDWALRSILYSGLILSAYFLLNFLMQSHRIGVENVILERYVGGAMSLPWGASNTIAQVLLISVGAYISIEHKGLKDQSALFFVFIAIVLTFSRSCILFLVLMSMIIWGGKRVLLYSALFGLVIVLLNEFFGFLDVSRFEHFIISRFDSELIAGGNGRLDSLKEKLDYFYENPLLPSGYYSSIYLFDLSAHNYFVTTLIEQSVLSLGVSILFFAFLLYLGFKVDKKVFLAFFVILLALCVEDPHFTQPYIQYFWTLISTFFVAGVTSKKESI